MDHKTSKTFCLQHSLIGQFQSTSLHFMNWWQWKTFICNLIIENIFLYHIHFCYAKSLSPPHCALNETLHQSYSYFSFCSQRKHECRKHAWDDTVHPTTQKIMKAEKREMRKQMIETTATCTPNAPWCSVCWDKKVLYNKCSSLSQNLISYSGTPQVSFKLLVRAVFIFRNLWLMTQGNKSWREKRKTKKNKKNPNKVTSQSCEGINWHALLCLKKACDSKCVG